MKKIIQYCMLLLACGLFSAQQVTAQLAPRPALWFSFDGTNVPYTTAAIGQATVVLYNSVPVTRTPDRFPYIPNATIANNPTGAVSFWDQANPLSTLVAADVATNDPSKVKLFGYSNNTINLPDTFVLSCWVYVDPTEGHVPRKIFYADYNNSRFALIHNGSDIYLRRVGHNNTTNTDNVFNYYFGAPASFDAGPGWYMVILLVSKRAADGAKYCKLYVGKPGYVKYDITGPRVIASTTDPLATNFGGAYAFTGAQDFMNSGVSAWGMGNADNNDVIYGANLMPVRKIDDFTIWDVTLNEMQAKALFVCESDAPASSCWVSDAGRKATQPLQPVADTVAKNNAGITVFPNPTTGGLWVTLPPVNAGGNIILKLDDLSGRVLYTRSLPAQKAAQTIRLDNIKTFAHAAGVYLLEVVTCEEHKTFKILVE